MHAADRRSPDRAAVSYQTRRGQSGKLPIARGVRWRTGSMPAAFPAKRAKPLWADAGSGLRVHKCNDFAGGMRLDRRSGGKGARERACLKAVKARLNIVASNMGSKWWLKSATFNLCALSTAGVNLSTQPGASSQKPKPVAERPNPTDALTRLHTDRVKPASMAASLFTWFGKNQLQFAGCRTGIFSGDHFTPLEQMGKLMAGKRDRMRHLTRQPGAS
jgi:hypothetical protein